MNKTYTVRFFTKDIVNGEPDIEHQIASFVSNKYIPIPQVGNIVCLDDVCPDVYKVTSVEYAYPCAEDEEYNYDVCVVVEMI